MNSASLNKSIPTVLIADDDASTRMLLRAIISPWHYPLLEASDGEEAWNILNGTDQPQIAIVDWMMPKMDGLRLCQLTKKLPNPPYMMLVSNRTESSNISYALDSGADDFLAKPFNYAELRIRLLIGQRIINFKNRLEAIEEEQPKVLEALKILPETIAKMSKINQSISTKLELLNEHAQNIEAITKEERRSLQKTVRDISSQQQQLTSEISSLEILDRQ